jgi:hypothetical protein
MRTHLSDEPVEIVADDREHEPDVVDGLRSIPSVSV